ncbi:MAG: hypothetical protein ACYC4D_02760 [Thermoleophilia bacterium]
MLLTLGLLVSMRTSISRKLTASALALEGFSEHLLTGVGIKQGQEKLKKYIDPDI